MEWVNTAGKSVAEAIEAALDSLGVDESDAEIVVEEEPKQGLFGRTRGQARVKVRVKPKDQRPNADGRDRNRNRKRWSEKVRSGEDSPKSSTSAPKNRNPRAAGIGKAESKRRPNEEGRSQSKENRQGKGQRKQATRNDRSRNRPERGEVSMEEVANEVENFLTGLVSAFGFEPNVKIDKSEEDGILASVEGEYGLLVGPKGRTLDAIQELTRVVAMRAVPNDIRIKVDVGGYRAKRRVALEAFALKAADKAIDEGSEVSLDAMNSSDRKAVHDALTSVEGVETRSAGHEPSRRVVVVPSEQSVSEDSSDDEQTADDGAEASAASA